MQLYDYFTGPLLNLFAFFKNFSTKPFLYGKTGILILDFTFTTQTHIFTHVRVLFNNFNGKEFNVCVSRIKT